MNAKEAYKVLGVNSDTSFEKIKEKYHKLLLKHHPDKGGNSEIFCKINEAFKVIQNKPERTSKPDSDDSMSTIDIFKSFLKTHIQSKFFKEYKDLYLTLEEMYTGKIIKINMTKYIDCEKCIKSMCQYCSGAGKIKHSILILGMKQYIYTECESCDGFGYTRTCNLCNDGYIESMQVHTLKIKRGCQLDDKYSIDNGATIFVIKQYKHPRFKRCDNDLVLHKSISLYDAISCKRIKCKHLNGRVYSFSNQNTIQSEIIYQLDHLGMPIKNSKSFGNLYVKFDIILPTQCTLTSDEDKIMKRLFNIAQCDEDFSQCTNIDLKMSNENVLDKNLVRFIRVSG